MKKSNRHIVLCILMLAIPLLSGFGQNYFRISGDMTIKSKSAMGDQAMTMGKVFFDRNFSKIIYNISFPEPETWLTTDSLTYRIVNDSIVAKQLSMGMAEFSVFNLALNSHLPDFGLTKSTYHIDNVELDGDNIITTWAPQENMKEKMGNIMVSTKDKRLLGVVFLNVEGIVLRKQFFEEYQDISGVLFPSKIVEIAYGPEGKNYQISNFRNLKLNELENNSSYNYQLPYNTGN